MKDDFKRWTEEELIIPRKLLHELHEKAREIHELEQEFARDYPDLWLTRDSVSCKIKLNDTPFEKISTREPHEKIHHTFYVRAS